MPQTERLRFSEFSCASGSALNPRVDNFFEPKNGKFRKQQIVFTKEVYKRMQHVHFCHFKNKSSHRADVYTVSIQNLDTRGKCFQTMHVMLFPVSYAYYGIAVFRWLIPCVHEVNVGVGVQNCTALQVRRRVGGCVAREEG